MHKYSLWRYFSPLTCDELCPFYMNCHIKIEDHNNLNGALRDCLKCWNYYADFFSFSLFFLNNTPIEKKTGMFFSFILRAKIIASGSRWPTCDTNIRKSYHTLQTKFEVSTGIRIPQWEDRRKEVLPNPHLWFFYKSLEDIWLNKGKTQQLSIQLTGYTLPCQKAGPWKC